MNDLIRERYWMYEGRDRRTGNISEAFMLGVRQFVEVVKASGLVYEGNIIRCPCRSCKNNKWISQFEVEDHLYNRGFVPGYYNWIYHGEVNVQLADDEQNPVQSDESPMDVFVESHTGADNYGQSHFQEMVIDVVGPRGWGSGGRRRSNVPNESAQRFYALYNACLKPAFEGCTTESVLSFAMKLLQTKNDYQLPEGAFNQFCTIARGLLNIPSNIPSSFQQAKQLLSGLGMGYIRIDVCKRGCMIYYKEDAHLTECRTCGFPRYKDVRRQQSGGSGYKPKAISQMFYLPIIPRLERLFWIEKTASQMSWHATRTDEEAGMVHPCDGEAWKHFDKCHPDFAAEPRNVRLGLCSEGFNPYSNSAAPYSCWPVMVTPYNLPPWMCMKTKSMWLTIVIPGPKNPKKRFDIYLRPLIEDLLLLWDEGLDTWDAHAKECFTMRAALMWTISDFPAYAMLSGWSTAGHLGCPHCMEDTKAFWLANGKKHSYFDCHRRFLPRNHPFRRNKKNFTKGKAEKSLPVPFRRGEDVLRRLRDIPFIWDQTLNEKLPGFGETHNWTKRSVFWLLPYWKDKYATTLM